MLKDLTKKWWFWIVVAGVILRLIVMPITLHPDIIGQSIASYIFAYQGKMNIYDYLINLPKSDPLFRNYNVYYLFIYPPLTYYVLGFLRLIIRPISDSNFIPFLISNPGQIFSYPGYMMQILLLKLPYLFIDILGGFIFVQIFHDLYKKKIALILWMFNPLSIYATFMMGQNDILPVLFTVLALFFGIKNKKTLSILSLGLGGGFKLYPLLFLPPTAFIFGTNLKERIKYLILGFLPYILTSAPFLLSKGYRQIVLGNTESQKILFMGWPVSGAEAIFPFIMILIFIYLLSYYKIVKNIHLGVYYLAILLLLFSVTHYHPQWFLWLTPFLIWELVTNNFKHLILVIILLASWLGITLFFEPSLSYGLFNPILSELVNAKDLSNILGKYMDVFLFKSIIRSIFAGASLFYVISLFVTRRVTVQEKTSR